MTQFTRDKSGRYHVNGSALRELADVPGAVRALKKPIPITACRMSEAFTVETTEGVMKGRAGDWVMQGVAGELYICPAEVFEKSYDILPAHPVE